MGAAVLVAGHCGDLARVLAQGVEHEGDVGGGDRCGVARAEVGALDASLGQAREAADDPDERPAVGEVVVDALDSGVIDLGELLAGAGGDDDRPAALGDDRDHVHEQRAPLEVEPGLVASHPRRRTAREDHRCVHLLSLADALERANLGGVDHEAANPRRLVAAAPEPG